jgi:hypothetical protein
MFKNEVDGRLKKSVYLFHPDQNKRPCIKNSRFKYQLSDGFPAKTKHLVRSSSAGTLNQTKKTPITGVNL